jgi:DNA-binding GntR family transcriptional regulator
VTTGALTKTERLIAVLLDEIRSGHRPPGSPLPSRRELAAEHGEHAALEATRWLRDHGWVVTRVGAGAYVADPLPHDPASDVDRLTELEARIADLQRQLEEQKRERDVASVADLREVVGTLQAHLIELYARLGQPYPGKADRPRRGSSRKAANG